MIRILLGVLCFLFFLSPLPAQQDLADAVQSDLPYLQDLYVHLHKNPELSFNEYASAARMAEELKSLGFSVTEKYGGTGVVGMLKNGEGPTLLIRADMDALPLVEETGLPYASTVTTKDDAGNTVGVMHACGHDIHMTVWVGTARYLATHLDQWKGTLLFIGQPAEERSGGAKAMLAAGLYEEFPYPDYALALHVNADMPAGTIGYCPGYAMANVDMVDITVHGQGGHGANPHTTKDPIVLSAQLILALQTIVSREISPLEPAVVTVGSIHGGAKGNVIPNEVKLELTLRSYSDEVREATISAIHRICQGVAIAAGLTEDEFPTILIRNEFTPSLKNDPALTERIAATFRELLGAENVREVGPNMVGEDFGRFGRTEPAVPILLYWLGAVEPTVFAEAKKNGQTLPSLHSSTFRPDPGLTLRTGVTTMVGAVKELLPKK